MKKKRVFALMVLGFLFASSMISCHRNSCPTFGLEEVAPQQDDEVKS